MKSPASDLKDVLVSAGIGTFPTGTGWVIGISFEYTEPDSRITLYDYGGEDPLPNMLLDKPAVQVRVRGNKQDYDGAYAKANDIKNALLGLPSQTINGTVYTGVWTSEPNFLKYDENNRPIFTINCRVARQPPSGTYRS